MRVSGHSGIALAGITLVCLILTGLLAACSPKRMVVDMVGGAMAGSGGTYASDDDPDLVREALPFGLKTMEGLLEVSPENRDLLLATARGFTAYAYLLQAEADRIEEDDLGGARALRARAHRLYLRGRGYALRGLEVRHDGFQAALALDPEAALAEATDEDTAFLYWGGASWAGALSADKSDLELVAELPTAAALVARVLALDAAYDGGAAHEFFISYEGGRPGGDAELARAHYAQALALSGGTRASVHLALAETVAVQQQDLAEFERLLDAALAVDPDAAPELRLVNTLARRRAEWLRAHIPDLFLLAEEPLS